MKNEPLQQEAGQPAATKNFIIDCDVHCIPQHPEQIRKHVPAEWQNRFMMSNRDLYSHPIYVIRTDSRPPSGLPPASDPDFLRKQLIDEYGMTHIVIIQRPFTNPIPNPAYATVLANAFNDWLCETWLGTYNHDGVFKGSICVSTQDVSGAVREIERLAGHPHLVQVVTDSGSAAAYGQSRFDPIYEACQRHGLPFAMHAGADGVGLSNLPSSGYPTHYMEWSACHPLSYQAHLVSMLVEGVFERFPRLKVVMVEGGVSWLPMLLWRQDTQYERFRSEVPWLKRKPSEYIRDHVRFTSQPIERPDKDKHLLKLLDLMDAEHILMFSSDYPHWDFDDPNYAFPKLPALMRQRIFYENAKELYGL
ncbi:Predicted metal-dependent hydrolase, TIM-barrel fold [Paenibacillus sp. UNC496MF]|uniref:amidohydrolase family protein n=1 Tax=Paenibacillus sp. UNC496MF TaxID=1502753 RepID=UPI0008E03D0E|nr:amidohydrolase family protein [Paenibacillus sp. UNC496MF]SFJ91400.1 Predicted metal-dependent hydrolase, TIM-barrel fold [Paenibacillus sp. UNC496MF]